MADKIDYTGWTTEEIQLQIQKLSAVSPLTYRRSNHLIELGDGSIRVSSMQEDKSWTEWETIETPNLHVTEGKIVAKAAKILMIRVSFDESYELCSLDAEPWSDDDAKNCFNYGMGGVVMGFILSGRRDKTKLLTTRTTIPGTPFQMELIMRMGFLQSREYLGKPEQMYEDADRQYQNDGWVKYFPYEETSSAWTPKQEILYLKSLLKAKLKEENKAKVSEKSGEDDSIGHKTNDTGESFVEEASQKNYIIAALLAILLGGLGAHKFYMGKYLKGILYLVFFWTWIPSIIGVIEGVRYLLGGQEEFDEKLM